MNQLLALLPSPPARSAASRRARSASCCFRPASLQGGQRQQAVTQGQCERSSQITGRPPQQKHLRCTSRSRASRSRSQAAATVGEPACSTSTAANSQLLLWAVEPPAPGRAMAVTFWFHRHPKPPPSFFSSLARPSPFLLPAAGPLISNTPGDGLLCRAPELLDPAALPVVLRSRSGGGGCSGCRLGGQGEPGGSDAAGLVRAKVVDGVANARGGVDKVRLPAGSAALLASSGTSCSELCLVGQPPARTCSTTVFLFTEKGSSANGFVAACAARGVALDSGLLPLVHIAVGCRLVRPKSPVGVNRLAAPDPHTHSNGRRGFLKVTLGQG